MAFAQFYPPKMFQNLANLSKSNSIPAYTDKYTKFDL